MMQYVRSELEGIGNLVKVASIPEEEQRTAAWCIQKMPALCEAFCRTYESRYADELLRLEQGMLTGLGEKDRSSAEMKELAAALLLRFRELHERLGLPEPQASKASPAAPGRGKKSLAAAAARSLK